MPFNEGILLPRSSCAYPLQETAENALRFAKMALARNMGYSTNQVDYLIQTLKQSVVHYFNSITSTRADTDLWNKKAIIIKELGQFEYDASSSAVDDNATVITPTSQLLTTGRYIRLE